MTECQHQIDGSKVLESRLYAVAGRVRCRLCPLCGLAFYTIEHITQNGQDFMRLAYKHRNRKDNERT